MLTLVFLAVAAPTQHRFSVTFEHADLGAALRTLADVGDVNLVLPDDVHGDVDMRLKDVTIDEAFAALLMQKGLVAVSTGENLYTIQAARK